MSLRLWLPLLGNLKQQGASNAVITNDGAVVDNAGKIGKCYSFSNTHIIIDSTDIQDIFASTTSPFSMACWIYLNSDETDRVIIFGNYNANPFINWELAANCTQRVCAGGTSNYTNKTGTVVVPKTTWTHIAVTYDGTITTFYVNGVTNDSNKLSGANTITTKTASSRFYLGSDTRNDATRLKGKMNDFRLYDHCLSPLEVYELSRALVCHYKLNDIYGVNLLTTDIQVTMTGTADSVYSGYINLDPAVKTKGLIQEGTHITIMYDYTVNSLSASTKDTVWIYSQLNGSRLGPAAANTDIRTRTNGFILEEFIVNATQAAADTYQIRWRLQGNAATDSVSILNAKLFIGTRFDTLMIQDSSGYDHNMSIDFANEYFLKRWDDPDYRLAFYQEYYEGGYNSSIFSSRSFSTNTPRYNSCIKYKQGWQHDTTYEGGLFGGVPITGMTVAAWINPSVLTAQNNGIGFYTQNSTTDTVKVFEIKMGSSGYFAVSLGVGNATNTYNSNKVMPINAWHHYALTWENNSCKYYFDGELIYTRTLSISTPTAQNYFGFIIGDCNTDNYTALYSDVRGYLTALSDKDIRSLYNTGARAGNKKDFHTFEFRELDSAIASISKVGLVNFDTITEEDNSSSIHKDSELLFSTLVES